MLVVHQITERRRHSDGRRTEVDGEFKVHLLSFRRQNARLSVARPRTPSPQADSLAQQQDRSGPSVPFAPRPSSGRSALATGLPGR